MIVYAFSGSFCTIARSMEILRSLREAGEEILPVVSENVASTDTRFGRAEDILGKLRTITGREVISTIRDAEPIGPVIRPEILIVSPCTGNTLAKIAAGITDTAVTMAVKSQLRSDRPVLLALATNDGLSGNLSNIGTLLNKKQIYFVPMVQDDPIGKPHSLIADFEQIPQCLSKARERRQMRPIFLTKG